jgi:hypothetical protein
MSFAATGSTLLTDGTSQWLIYMALLLSAPAVMINQV